MMLAWQSRCQQAPDDLGFGCVELKSNFIQIATSSMHADIPVAAVWCLLDDRCMSSAYRCRHRRFDSKSRSKSAVYRRNKISPKTDPCGTLHKTSVTSDVDSEHWTNWVRLLRYDVSRHGLHNSLYSHTGMISSTNCNSSSCLHIQTFWTVCAKLTTASSVLCYCQQSTEQFK